MATAADGIVGRPEREGGGPIEGDVLSKNFAAAASALTGLLNETKILINAAEQGDSRSEATRPDSGCYRELVQGFNRVMEAIVLPITEASTVLERVAGGDSRCG